jgi:isocitrate dehydrogenase (NAD+)
VERDRAVAGIGAERATGKYLPEAVFESLARTGARLKRPVGTQIASGHPSVNVAIRKRLDLSGNSAQRTRSARRLRKSFRSPGAALRGLCALREFPAGGGDPRLKTRLDDLPIDLVIFRENTEHLYSGSSMRWSPMSWKASK